MDFVRSASVRCTTISITTKNVTLQRASRRTFSSTTVVGGKKVCYQSARRLSQYPRSRCLVRMVSRYASYNSLSPELASLVNSYFVKTVYPMLTPMLFDNYHAFPILKNNRLLLGVVTKIFARWDHAAQGFVYPVCRAISRFYELVAWQHHVVHTD